MLALANSVCLLALSGMYERESTAKHGTARPDTTPRHRTALCRAVELAKLSGAGVLLLCIQLSWA